MRPPSGSLVLSASSLVSLVQKILNRMKNLNKMKELKRDRRNLKEMQAMPMKWKESEQGGRSLNEMEEI
jgi:hypothetical protein